MRRPVVLVLLPLPMEKSGSGWALVVDGPTDKRDYRDDEEETEQQETEEP
jgi:hypothetical protein